ncbi:MAG: beta-glucosidase [Nitrospirales bacterium]|nr:MAG: beta-glucosidase [Nitrospirales bacterium]
MKKHATFPDGFLWGAATSAYQIEGAPLADGAGPSIWQRFAHTPGNILNGDTGDVACDHYHRWREDIALMKELGLQAYRFSVAWGRIFPEGKGRLNEKGLDFYERLVDGLLEAGIEPLLTLYHWDLPAALDDLGGWLNPDIAHWFADYGEAMYRRLDGRVKKWTTLNEPWVVTDGGYLHGVLAPGHSSHYEAPVAAHHLMRAHGAAVQAYRAVGAHEIGLVVNIEPKYPASDDAKDLAATNRADAYMNRQFLDPALLGSYPEEMTEIFGDAWPEWPAKDFDLICQKIDFVGLNYYTRAVTGDGPDCLPVRARTVRQPHKTYTETGWEVYPKGLSDTLLWLKKRYGEMPLYITENGSAFFDPPKAMHGRVIDPVRMHYLNQHLCAVRTAIENGVDVRGYMAWSLMDNYEWSFGYAKRFGIVHVDFETLERTPKDTARYYAKIIETNGAVLDEPFLPLSVHT